jgi:hypothetical protein
MEPFSLTDLSRLPGRTSRELLADDAARRAGEEILTSVFLFVHKATARGDHAEALLGIKFTAVIGHLCFPEPHRHTAKNAKKRGQDPHRARKAYAYEALRRTLMITPTELTEWVTERVERLDPRAERELPTADGPEDELEKLIAKVRRHCADGELSKAAGELPGITALQEGGEAAMRAGRILRMNAELRERLAALHPAPPEGGPPVPPLPQGRIVFQPTSDEVWEALKSFPRSTGLGPSGFPVQALKSVCVRMGKEDESACLQALTLFVGDIMRGGMPAEVMAVWASARLLALTKANGKPRPIAVGEIFRRLAAKCAVKHSAEVLAERLRPTQRGVGVSGGVEHLAHTITVLLEAHPDWCVLAVDIKNAFNSILRSSILQETIAHLPEVADFIFGCYGGPSAISLAQLQRFPGVITGSSTGRPAGSGAVRAGIPPGAAGSARAALQRASHGGP